MYFKLIFTGLIFFLNFNIGIVDILPDFIGCLFIVAGMSKLRDIDGRFEYCHMLMKYMTAYSVLKAVISVIQRNYTLSLTFMACVIETLFLIVFFTNFFGAIEYTAQRHGGSFMSGVVMTRTKDKHTGKTQVVPKMVNFANRASIMSWVFSIAKGVLTFIPESIELLGHTDELDLSYNANRFSVALAKPPVMLLCYTAIAVCAICFIIICGSYLLKVSKDSQYISALCNLYNEQVAPNRKLFISRAIGLGFVLIFVGLVFMLDFKVEYLNMIPDALGYILLAVAFGVISKQSEYKGKLAYVCAIISITVSVFNTYYMYINESTIKYKGTAGVTYVGESVADGSACMVTLVGNLIESFAFVILICCIVKAFRKLPFSKATGDIGIHTIILKASAILFALCSTADNFLTLAKAYFAINSTNIISDVHDFSHLAVRVSMYLFLILTARGFMKLKEWVSLYV